MRINRNMKPYKSKILSLFLFLDQKFSKRRALHKAVSKWAAGQSLILWGMAPLVNLCALQIEYKYTKYFMLVFDQGSYRD